MIDPYKLTQYLLRELNDPDFDDLLVPLGGGPGMSPENPVSLQQLPGVFQQLAGRRQELLPGSGS